MPSPDISPDIASLKIQPQPQEGLFALKITRRQEKSFTILRASSPLQRYCSDTSVPVDFEDNRGTPAPVSRQRMYKDSVFATNKAAVGNKTSASASLLSVARGSTHILLATYRLHGVEVAELKLEHIGRGSFCMSSRVGSALLQRRSARRATATRIRGGRPSPVEGTQKIVQTPTKGIWT